MIRSQVKRMVLRNSGFIKLLNRVAFHNKIKVAYAAELQLNIRRLIRNSAIHIVGRDNYIEIGETNGTSTINIHIRGNHNQIIIEDNVFCADVTLWIEDDNNSIYVKSGTVFTGQIQLSAIEGTKIEIGNDCLFSSDIDIRTGDGHSVMDLQGNRTNYSEDIIIGNHVWCGKSVSILKSGGVASDCIIATRAVVTKKISEKHVVIAGSPALIVKRNTQWSFDRV